MIMEITAVPALETRSGNVARPARIVFKILPLEGNSKLRYRWWTGVDGTVFEVDDGDFKFDFPHVRLPTIHEVRRFES